MDLVSNSQKAVLDALQNFIKALVVSTNLYEISQYSIQFDTEYFIKSQHVRCLVPNQNNTSQWDTIKHVI